MKWSWKVFQLFSALFCTTQNFAVQNPFDLEYSSLNITNTNHLNIFKSYIASLEKFENFVQLSSGKYVYHVCIVLREKGILIGIYF